MSYRMDDESLSRVTAERLAQEKIRQAKARTVRNWVAMGIATPTLLIAALMFGIPQYRVYSARLDGEAILAKAESARQVQVRQAQGEKDAAVMRAEAIAIVGQAAKNFPEYRQQEFIGGFAEALKEGKINQVIYVPTEASIPILEAGRRKD